APPAWTADYTNSTGMTLVDIPAGCFQMGRDANFEQGEDNELPQHRVCVSAFQMGKYEVTQAEWVAVMGSNPSNFKGRTNPVEQVS
ncbi:SUMF1/EgtB/PvdO family nonheme iron enzyme, partial [Klebsiella pneumoniae]|uniref:formylglycine-generating enzyme family protein n=1 Tax=Klebsiella pneumoniae TaxID=573 RepID=UPI0030135489